jgi:Xaa-Pro dipeptidase
MHLLAEKIIIEGLVELGVLIGDVDEIQGKRIGAVFFPHGLGHFLGHDTHDVGGYICGHQRSTEPGIRCLRTRRQLEAGMIITVEPGCYFIDFAIDQALQDEGMKGFIGDKVNEFRGFGGVRIEDDVLVTENGGVILTNVPRTVEDIERVMAGGEWVGEN